MFIKRCLFCLSVVYLVSFVSAQYHVETFQSPDNTDLSKLVIDRNTEIIYIAGTNRLFRLSPGLELEQTAITGPKEDNAKCHFPFSSCSETLNYNDSYSKALIIDYTGQRLIICSSLYQGFCERRWLNDIVTKDLDIITPVVTNNSTASTVAFIALGPAENDFAPQPNVLYVGATWTETGLPAYRDLVPAFCCRKLDGTYDLAYKYITTSSKKIESRHREFFPVFYIFGFASDNFSYMVTIQKINTHNENYISKLVRVCQNDRNFYSYTEVQLSCFHNGAEYNLVQAAYVGRAGSVLAETMGIPTTEDVLYAVFSVGNPSSIMPSPNTALCVYPMRQVRRVFTQNIKRCFEGKGNTGPDHIVSPGSCSSTEFAIDDNYCGTYDINTPINGPDPITAEAGTIFNTSMSAIAVSITHRYTVAFIGTGNGHVQKVSIESQVLATAYESIVVEEGSKILSDMLFDRNSNFLHVMTARKVYKLRVQNCNQYKSCADCLGVKDPYCGWCSLENKCSIRSECRDHDADLRWLSYSGQTCTTISWVKPNKIQKEANKREQLQLNISNLPVFGGIYVCTFSYQETTLPTSANRSGGNLISCGTPASHLLPPIPTGEDHMVMKLTVQMNNQDFVWTNFTFFDCGLHESCTSCLLSDFPCNWCVQNHMCTHNLDDCLGDMLVVDAQKPDFCPRIDSEATEILVPSSTSKKVSVLGIHLPDPNSPIQCYFIMNSGIQVQASVTRISDSSHRIECATVQFSFIGDTPHRNVPFQIIWGDNKPLDNPENVQVKMYKCDAMADSCGSCLTMENKYMCGWCGSRCSIQMECQTDWLSQSFNCPNPYITSFYPKTGVRSGGTFLTISGVNLGKTFENIDGGVSVANVECTPMKELYIPSERIVCKTGEILNKTPKGHVRVIVDRQYATNSQELFYYVEPVLRAVHPEQGPMAGGTKIEIFGEFLDAATNISVFIGDMPCPVISNSATAIECITQQSDNLIMKNLYVRLDNQHTKTSISYTYIVNPNITAVEPKHAILSGGISIFVWGQHLESILEPRMRVWIDKEAVESECMPLSSTRIQCWSPYVADRISNETHLPHQLSYGFQLDNVTEFFNITNYNFLEFQKFQIYPDPQFTPFPGSMVKAYQSSKNDYLIIDGQNLNLGIRKEDVTVMIGDAYCNVTSFGNQLTCRPPKYQPKTKGNNDYPEVVVKVGNNLTILIGYLQYDEDEFLTKPAIIGIGTGASVLLVLVAVLMICYYIKSEENNNKMKKMQFQMDNLEAKVAKECKEAFAELQTDMTELNSDYSGQIVIPYWDYRTYCMKVMFPQEQEFDHPVIRQELDIDYSRRESVEKGLWLFSQLINNKTFLLIFIRTLEGDKRFNMRDRVNLASLISVALQTKMEYATDILKTLLAELIEKSLEGKSHPKLLLRRTESVAEKMLTNWFTLLLYKFLRDCSGEPLFMLYQAIKQQVSKGPVDACTNEARYSLSEDKLIRQQLDYKSMTILVQDMEQYGQQPQQVKVLDCDTISQVKEKILDAIYKNAPFSSRPGRDDVDLALFDQSSSEWHMGMKGRLILQDDDNTTKMDGEHKKLNTLAHYKVLDGAYVTLVGKQPQSIYNISLSSVSKMYDNLTFSGRSPSLNRTMSPSAVHVDVDGSDVKHYHLVKQHDSETHMEGDRGSKMVSEIYLTRLLTTKGTLQKFVDDLFERLFSTSHRGTALPLAIKYMFDFLDDQALLHNIQDAEVVHIWKSNSLPLRFWVNVIQNPNFVFDIYKSNIVDSCLSVIAQTFMDSCSISEHRLGKDSPSNKLLYAKDIPKYKKWVERYYQDIKMMPAISDQDMTAMMTEESRIHQHDFHSNAALMELYKYVHKFYDDVMQALEEDEFARKNKLTYKLEQVRTVMEGQAYC